MDKYQSHTMGYDLYTLASIKTEQIKKRIHTVDKVKNFTLTM